MGEIAEALKRSREEREAKKSQANARPAPSQPGRAELVEALQRAADSESEERPPRPPASATHEPSSIGERPEPLPVAPPGATVPEVADTTPGAPLLELTEAALASVGKVELHRQLALQVAAHLEHAHARSFAVVSALRNEGKTTVATTLAMALASVTSDRCVALVDLDLRNPSVARRLEAPRGGVGVERYFLANAPLEAIRVSVANPQLDVYPGLDPQLSAHELLARPRLADLVRELEARYQVVIFDTPPTLVVPDASMLIKHVPRCITVARAGISRARRFQEMLDLLPRDAVLGKVLNSASVPSRDKYYYEYGYGPEEDASTPDSASS